MGRKPLSMFTALLVGLALSIPASVSSQAIVLIAAFMFAGFSPGETFTFVFQKVDRSASPTAASSGFGDDITYTITLVNTSSGDSMEACRETFETEVAFTGISANFLKLSVVDDGTQAALHVGDDVFQLDYGCFGGATGYVVGIGRTLPTDGPMPTDRLYFSYRHFDAALVSDPSTGATRAMDRPFLMAVEDVFSIAGRGTVAFGIGETLEIYGSRPGQAAEGGGIFNNQGTLTIVNSTLSSSIDEPCEATIPFETRFAPDAVVNYVKVTVVGGFERSIVISGNESPLPDCFNGANRFLVGMEKTFPEIGSDVDRLAPLWLRRVGHRIVGTENDTRDMGVVFQSYNLIDELN